MSTPAAAYVKPVAESEESDAEEFVAEEFVVEELVAEGSFLA